MNAVALVDDHVLLRQGLAGLINTFPGYEVRFEADNGLQLTERIGSSGPLNAILLDINMPAMDGFATAAWMKSNHPDVKVLALSMSDEEEVIIKMLQAGAHGYVLKNATPEELKHALDTVIAKGYYLDDALGINVIHSLSRQPSKKDQPFDISVFNEKELQFIRLSCTERTYAEIASEMSLSPKTMEFYKEKIEEKTGIRNRISLVLFALKTGIIKL